MKKKRLLAIALITQSLNPLIPPALAAPDNGHGHAHGHAHSHTGTKTVTVPESRQDLWTAIQTEHDALLKAVENKADGAVHESEANLQAYMKALPEKITDLDDAARKRIEGQARNLARAYGAIHHAADDKAWDKAAAEMKKAEGGMKLLTAQMPK